MKVLMSLLELTALVRKTYSLPETAELEVMGQIHPYALELEAVFKRKGYIDGDTRKISSQYTIAAIKELRELIGAKGAMCGLAKAKYAIDDWERFFAYVSKNGYPDMNSSVTNIPWLE